MSERTEALMRIVIGIISGVVFYAWTFLIEIISVIHWLYVIFTGKRSKDLAEFVNHWNTAVYEFFRYMTFTTNTRPFPFNPLNNVKDKIDMKRKR